MAADLALISAPIVIFGKLADPLGNIPRHRVYLSAFVSPNKVVWLIQALTGVPKCAELSGHNSGGHS